ncbi:MAG: hypothetical protein BWZ08_02264 [candidate division BRC1 bacterium ADurb.BinA292]|nr:MAG: hypothetical protein BWZ08_02264 [candidate division BRC1 bacterium ADurb.BinA292]
MGGRIARDQRPARPVRGVGRRAVQQVAVEEQGCSGLHFAVDQLAHFPGLLHPFQIGAGLIADQLVRNPSNLVGALENLQAAVLTRGAIDRDQAAQHVGIEITGFVPVTVILMPDPGAAGPRFLEHHLGVVVIYGVAEQLLGGVDDPRAAAEQTVDVVARDIPQRELADAAGPIGQTDGVLLQGPVIAGGRQQQVHFFLGEQAGQHQVAVVVELTNLGRRDGNGHGATPYRVLETSE